MTSTILVLTEDTLTPADIEHILQLREDADVNLHVLVPADTERNLFVAILDQMYLGGLRDARDVLRKDETDTKTATSTAREQLDSALEAFHAAGATAFGEITEDDPLPALRTAVQTKPDVVSVVVVTHPHAIEDTFRQDWASRAREELKVPVLHIYRGTNKLG